MSNEVDELFGAADAPKPRLGLVWGLLTLGVGLAVAGMVCTAAPGGILVLLAWMVVEKELDRVRSGYLSLASVAAIQKARAVALVSVVMVIVLFMLQGYWLAIGRYDPVWGAFVEQVAALRPVIDDPDPDPDPTPTPGVLPPR